MSETPMNKLRELCEKWRRWAEIVAGRETSTPETRAQATGWNQCSDELRAILPDVEREIANLKAQQAVEAEREACAKICDAEFVSYHDAANRIRARGSSDALADMLAEADHAARWIQHQVHCAYCNQGARGCDIGRGLEAKR